ncbi:hypothetical protein GOBAR_AA07376 [Gossypium barbadense]|uniref:Uncharacterized protein n=1 Tax=Gossypium barbadense TaxID=3634 RepID=A0A2P5YCH0_GOSBA|nr:hypothetical protein GOBAR_AA07376 [Gossypium barbadense]
MSGGHTPKKIGIMSTNNSDTLPPIGHNNNCRAELQSKLYVSGLDDGEKLSYGAVILLSARIKSEIRVASLGRSARRGGRAKCLPLFRSWDGDLRLVACVHHEVVREGEKKGEKRGGRVVHRWGFGSGGCKVEIGGNVGLGGRGKDGRKKRKERRKVTIRERGGEGENGASRVGRRKLRGSGWWPDGEKGERMAAARVC